MNANKRLSVKLIHCGNANVVNPDDREQKNIFFMPMGLFPLADALRTAAFDVEIIHLDLEAGKTIEEILDFAALDVVGFDCHWVNQGNVVLETAAAVKKIKPGVFIVMGGFTSSLFAEEILTHYPQIDAVVRGDGETPIVELCRRLERDMPENGREVPVKSSSAFEEVPNLAWRDPAGGGDAAPVVLNDISYTAEGEDMAELDFAAVDLLRNWETYRELSRFYSAFEPISSTPLFLLEPGRGCQYACTFCGGNCEAQKRMNNRTETVFRPVETVLETVKKAVSLGFPTIYTCMESEDSDEWYIRLLEKIKREGLRINYGYGCWRIPSEPLVDALSDACNQAVIEISPETGDYRLRKKNKDIRICYTNQQLEACLAYIAGKDNVKVQLFFGYYLSDDTHETILATIRYIMELLLKFHGVLEVEYANFSTDPGSLYFFFPEKYGIDIKVRNFRDYIDHLKEQYVEQKGRPADMTVFKPTYISDEENVLIHRDVYLFNYLFSLYRKSASYILEKTGPAGVMELLENTGVRIGSDLTFSPDEVKTLLLEHAREKDVLDLYLSKLIAHECENQKSTRRVSKPTTQLFLDFQKVEHLLDDESLKEVSAEEGDKISSEIRAARETIDADFDF